MIVIALLGLHLAALRALFIHEPFLGLGTIYSEQYSEARFTTLRVGMSPGEVQAIMGQPLRVVPWNQHTGPRTKRCGSTAMSPTPSRISTGDGFSLRRGRSRS